MEKVRSLTIQEAEARVLDTGLLYAINALILHPVGIGLSFTTNDAGETYLEVVQTLQGWTWSFSKEAELAGKKKLMLYLSGVTGLPVEAHELLRKLAE